MANLTPYNRGNKSLTSTGFNDFYSMIDDFFSDPWFSERRLASRAFCIDVQEKDKEYLIEAELPGVAKDQVSIDLNEGNLSIAVQREDNINEENKNYIHRERRFASMRRNIYLGDADAAGIRAKLNNGVLMITVPRQEKADNTKHIEIE